MYHDDYDRDYREREQENVVYSNHLAFKMKYLMIVDKKINLDLFTSKLGNWECIKSLFNSY